jgi:hypothetical protein
MFCRAFPTSVKAAAAFIDILLRLLVLVAADSTMYRVLLLAYLR